MNHRKEIGKCKTGKSTSRGQIAIGRRHRHRNAAQRSADEALTMPDLIPTQGPGEVRERYGRLRVLVCFCFASRNRVRMKLEVGMGGWVWVWGDGYHGSLGSTVGKDLISR